MSESLVVAGIGALVSIAVAIIANRYTSRTARQAQETTAELEDRKLDASTWKEQYQGWKDDAIKLRELREQDRKDFETSINECKGLINELRAQIDWMKEDRMRDQAYLYSVNAWCRAVVVLLRDAGIPYPPPPRGLDATDPHGFPAQPPPGP
jgi:uncharacterized membrane-anchored protein YhcB (DUF1043 family)